MAMAMASPSPVQRQRCLWTPCVAPDAPLRVRRELHGAAGAAAGFAAAALRPRASRRFPRRGAKDPAVPAATVSLPEVLRFVWPVMLTFLASTVQGLIDSAFVGRCGGSVQLAALAPGTSWLDSLSYLLSFISIGTLNVLATAKDAESRERLLSRSVMVAWCVGAVAAVPCMLWAPYLVALCGARGPVVPFAASYVKIRALGLPLDSLFRVCNAGLLSVRDSRTGLQVVGLQSLLNGIGDALICPRLGIAGAAITTLAAQGVTTLGMLWALRRKGLIKRFTVPSLEDCCSFLAFALPVCLTLALKVASVQFLSIAAAAKGVVAAAAHQITKSLLWVFGLLASESLSSTAQAFLPAFMQQKDQRGADQTLRLLLRLALLGAVGTVALLLLMTSQGGLRLFCEDEEVLKAVPVVSLSCCILLTPFTFCMEGAHIAAQRQQWLSRRLFLLTSLVGVSFHFLPQTAQLPEIWAVFVVYLFARGVWYSWGLWRPGGVLRAA